MLAWRARIFFFLSLVFSLYIVSPFLLPLALGITLAYLSEAPIERILARIGKPRNSRWHWLVALVVVLGLLTVFLIPFLVLSYRAAVELAGFVSDVNGGVNLPELVNSLASASSRFLQELGLPVSGPTLMVRLRAFAGEVANATMHQIGTVLSGTPQVLFQVTVAGAVWVYFSVKGRGFRELLLPILIPWAPERELVARTTSDVLRAIIVANLLVSLVQAALVSFILGVTNIPNFFLWGGVAFFASFVPVIGTAPVMLGAAVYCFTQDRLIAAGILVLAAVLVGAVDNILRPFFVKGGVSLNVFWIFIAILGGIGVFGMAGAVLGPLAFSLFVASLHMLDSFKAQKLIEDGAPQPAGEPEGKRS